MKAPNCCQMVNPGANESRANILTKSMDKMHKTRGIHCKITIDFFIL